MLADTQRIPPAALGYAVIGVQTGAELFGSARLNFAIAPPKVGGKLLEQAGAGRDSRAGES